MRPPRFYTAEGITQIPYNAIQKASSVAISYALLRRRRVTATARAMSIR